MIIPYQSLAAQTLEAIIEAFVLQEGTEYGANDVSLEQKIQDVKLQLSNKTAVLVFSELHQTVNILPIETFQQTVDASLE
jgi:hypothetical protein